LRAATAVSAAFEGQPEPHQGADTQPRQINRYLDAPGSGAGVSALRRSQSAALGSEFARRAGFEKPILHGMCTYGITCRGILQTYADYDAGAFRQHAGTVLRRRCIPARP